MTGGTNGTLFSDESHGGISSGAVGPGHGNLDHDGKQFGGSGLSRHRTADA